LFDSLTLFGREIAMMRRLPFVALVFAAVFTAAFAQPLIPAAHAQVVSSRGLIDPAAARSIGLERMWFTQLSMDSSRSKLAGLHQRVSETEFRTIFEFVHGGVRRTFSARELEESGRPLRDVAVLAVLEEATPANPPAGQAPAAAKFKVVTVLKGPTIAQPDQVLDVPYVGDARKGSTFLITGSELIRGATPPAINWWMPLAVAESAVKTLSVPDAYTAGVDRALQHAEQELASIRNSQLRLNPDKVFADDSLPQIDGHVVPQITLYGASERGLVHALDGETGRTLWSVGVGNPNFPTTVPGANDRYVAVINGSRLYVISAKEGEVLTSKFTVGAPGNGPALSDNLLFVPMINGAIETFDLNDPDFPARFPSVVFRSFGRAMTQPSVSPVSVAWPTDKGNLYVGSATSPNMRFRLEAGDTIDSAPSFLAPNLILATSLDGYVYCFDERRGALEWRFTTGEPISHSPITLGDTVYAITDRGNMYAINVADASEKWLTGGIKKFLASNAQRLYCIDTSGNLVILDAKSGGPLGSLPTLALDMHYLNHQTDRILIGTRGGLIQCLRESTAYYPTIHFGEVKARPAAPPKQGGRPIESEPAGDSPASDPFSAPAGADPFAAPPAGGAKPPEPMPPPAADPFATPAP
jgi:outer membrane protein assembly factor BamB